MKKPEMTPDWLIVFQTAFALPEVRRAAALIAQERGLRLATEPARHERLLAAALSAT